MATPTTMNPRAAFPLLTLVLLSLASVRARADLTLDQYVPAPVVSDGFALSRPDVRGHLLVGAQLQLDFARDPLVWQDRLGDESTVRSHIVKNHLVGRALVSLSIHERALVFVHLPVQLVMSGDTGESLRADGPGLGNAQVGVRVRLLGTPKNLFSLGVQGAVSVPTSQVDSSSQLSGETRPTARMDVVARLKVRRLSVHAQAGARYRKESVTDSIKVAPSMPFGVGLGYEVLSGPTQIELLAELFGGTDFEAFATKRRSPTEFLGGAKLCFDPGVWVGAAGGMGITQGVGDPKWRVVGMLGYLAAPLRDRDGDKIPDRKDQCPDQKEDVDSFRDTDGCPDPDNDEDGVVDTGDECPLEAEDRDDFEDANGCPDPDNDGDGIVDTADKCPLQAEDRDGFQDDDGCPDLDDDADGVPDTSDQCRQQAEDRDGFYDEDGCPDLDNDGDGIPDAKDSCPLEAETINQRDDEDGCPDRIRVDRENSQIQILEPVRFVSSSAQIASASFEMLGEIAEVLKNHPEIALLRVEGHTDSRGSDRKNQALSEARAKSVRDFLVQGGVAETRLVAEGLGETKPRADNETDAGRTQNRRVEFHIVMPTEPSP